MNTYAFDLQGHRGARGLMPENTIPAFLLALDLGVDTLELDVVISRDHQVVVSHDPIMSPLFCSGPDGRPVTDDPPVRLYDLTYDEIAAFDCGARPHPGFPEQQALPAVKPRLVDVCIAVHAHVLQTGRPVPRWNIETKSTPDGDGLLHPDPSTFTDLLLEAASLGGILNRLTLQSFDPRTLQHARAVGAPVKLSALVGGEQVVRLDENLAYLGFVPDVYSPDHEPLDPALVDAIRRRGMAVLPWTVNEPARMRELLDMGVHGFITDYPDRARPFHGS